MYAFKDECALLTFKSNTALIKSKITVTTSCYMCTCGMCSRACPYSLAAGQPTLLYSANYLKKKYINYINKATPQGFEQARLRQESRTRVGYGLLAEFFCLNDGCKSKHGAPRLSVVNKCLFRKISWHTDFATHCARFCESKNAEKHDLLFLFCIN